MPIDTAKRALVTSAAMAHSALDYFPPTRQQLLRELRRRGEARAEELAQAVGITVGGVRQQLMALYGDGLVVFREAAEGPGRPKHYYRITASAEALFPDQSRDLLERLTDYLERNAPDLIAAFLDEYAAELQRTEPTVANPSLPIDQRLQVMLSALERRGFMPELEHAEDGSLYVNLHHCPLLRFARGSAQICEFSRRPIADVVGPDVRRVAWRLEGDSLCTYRFILPAAGDRPG